MGRRWAVGEPAKVGHDPSLSIAVNWDNRASESAYFSVVLRMLWLNGSRTVNP
jgi:hypothetical protein